MWAWLYVALFAFATATTYWGVIVHETGRDDRMVVFPSGMAAAAWTFLALTPELVLDDGTAVTLGAERWLFAAFALLCGMWLTGVVLGIFPEDSPEEAPSGPSDRRINL